MTSIWERMGEGVGYAIGAALFGPGAAIARRERRTLRSAFHEWAGEVDATDARPHAKGLGQTRVDDTTLDAKGAEELAREIAETPIGALETFALTLRSDRVVIVVMAPRARAEWRAIEKTLVVLVESWSRRWATSYR